MAVDRNKELPPIDTLPGGVLLEPKVAIKREYLDALVYLKHGDPNYPLKAGPFEKEYRVWKDPRKKFEVAVQIGRHPGFTRHSMLINDFTPLGEEATPEGQMYFQHLQYHVRAELLKRGDKKEKKTAEAEVEDFADHAAKKDTPEAVEFRKLVDLFGSSRVVDILFRTRPSFRGIAVETVSGILADYLGDVLLVKGGFKIDDLEAGVQYLSDPKLKEGLTEVVKDSCITVCQQEKKKNPTTNLRVVISEYLDSILDKAGEIDNQYLWEVTQSLFDYYDSMFKIRVPDHMVTQLREGRDFPDLSQLINIKEIEDKKRFVLADDMGMGKSASPIIVKERQKIKTAVVVAPASVINDPNTWQAYLSDKVDENGRQRGYYKEGKAPKVLVVNSLDQLKKPEVDEEADQELTSPEDYDFILISQERLTTPYTDALLNVDYGMLIVDEAHRLKKLNGGRRAGSLLRLAEKVEGDDEYLVLLSGTPVPNKVEDVGMIIRLLYPDRFKDMNDKTLIRNIIKGDIVDLRSLLMPRMQTKNIQDNLDLPPLHEEVIRVQMSPLEREIYGILLEEDEIEATEKIKLLRQFVLNPDLLNVTPGVESSKISALNADLKQKFETKDRVIVFFNDYIEGILRGDNSIVSKLELPEGVTVKVVHGETSVKEREAVAQEFRTTGEKMLLLVSGQTVEVGNDYSRGQAVGHYNDPWTRYRKNQQTGRVYREGVEGAITSTSYIVDESIEEGIDIYTLAKFKAVEKLLKGVPRTELEQALLELDDGDEAGLEVNPELAEYYFSAWDRMRHMFGYAKEVSEPAFKKFLQDFGTDYAQGYFDLGSRSYEANANRVLGTLLNQMIEEKGEKVEDVKILDVASGPQMLKRHMPDEYSSRVVSIDINPSHFTQNPEAATGDRVIGSFLHLPFATGSFDYTNLSFAWHNTTFVPSRDQSERLELLRELHRVTKLGGRAVINSIYSLDIKDEEKLKEVAETIGFGLVEEYTGEASSGRNYQSKVYTFEKQHDFGWTLPEVMQLIGKENHNGLKFRNNDIKLRDTRRILSQFEFTRNGADPDTGAEVIPVAFNQKDHEILQEEQSILSHGEQLKTDYGTIADIPRDIVIDSNFIRVRLGKRYALFRRLQTAGGVVVIK